MQLATITLKSAQVVPAGVTGDPGVGPRIAICARDVSRDQTSVGDLHAFTAPKFVAADAAIEPVAGSRTKNLYSDHTSVSARDVAPTYSNSKIVDAVQLGPGSVRPEFPDFRVSSHSFS